MLIKIFTNRITITETIVFRNIINFDISLLFFFFLSFFFRTFYTFLHVRIIVDCSLRGFCLLSPPIEIASPFVAISPRVHEMLITQTWIRVRRSVSQEWQRRSLQVCQVSHVQERGIVFKRGNKGLPCFDVEMCTVRFCNFSVKYICIYTPIHFLFSREVIIFAFNVSLQLTCPIHCR